MGTRIKGAAHEPKRLRPKFGITPMLLPRLAAVDSIATSDCAIGSIGPSARPISRRAETKVANEAASPEANEHSENATTVINNKVLRLPVRSEYQPPRNEAIAQVKDSAEATQPTCSLLKCKSSAMKGIRKLAALRSKKTKPKVMVRTQISLVSYFMVVCGRVTWPSGSCSLSVESNSSPWQTLVMYVCMPHEHTLHAGRFAAKR